MASRVCHSLSALLHIDFIGGWWSQLLELFIVAVLLTFMLFPNSFLDAIKSLPCLLLFNLVIVHPKIVDLRVVQLTRTE